MKQKLIHFLSIFVAFLTAIPIANAAPEDYVIKVNTTPQVTYSADWYSTIWNEKYSATVMVVSNDVAYSIMPGANKVSYYNFSNNTSGALASGETTANNCGWGIACDDAGNIIYAKGSNFIKKSNKIAIIPSSGASGVVVDIAKQVSIDLTSVYTESLGTNNDRVDYWFASGNCLSAEGGYVWFAVPTKIVRIKIVNGKATQQDLFSLSSAIPTLGQDTRTSIFPYANGQYLLQASGTSSNGGYVYDCTLSGNVFNLSLIHENRFHSADIDFLREHKIMVRNNNKSTKDGKIDVVDMTTNSTLASFYSYNGATSSGYGNVNSWNILQKVNDNEMALYTYVPQSGFSKFSITATPNFITNVSHSIIENGEYKKGVKLTWVKPANSSPTKYRVSYSIDGGSTWSSSVETTDLNYTFNDLNSGKYIFKVEPYYSSSASWGQAVSSNSVTVITAVGAPISNLAYTYLKNTETNIGRQDITLTWDAPTGMINTTLTGYKVYRGGSLLATLGADALTYTNTGVKQNYTYKVVPTFDGLTEDASFGLEVTTTEVQAGVLVAPVISETRNYEGYSLVEIFFKMPNYAPYKPLYFNLYRDGKLIQGKLQSYNTLDESLVRASVETTVKYQVEAVYGTAADVYPPIDSVKSDITTLVIAPRDWAKTGYILQEVYNVPIDEISGTIPSDFSKVDYYRQGQFNKAEKKWYIAQRGNATDGVAGVITFDAETKDDVIKGSTQYYNHVVDANVGIAIDDVGTILIKNNNNTTLAASRPTSTSINSHAETGRTEYAIPTWLNDKYDRRITSALLIAKDGTTKEVDLSNVWIGTNGFVNDMYFNLEAAYTNNGVTNYSTDYGQTRGRSDYYYMWGDVLSANGGYLVFSPSWTRTAFKVKIANGAYVSHEVIEFNRYENTGYLLEPKTGTENYGFKLDGRDDVTVQIRSNGYYGVHEWNKEGTTGWHPIFTADSRINNAGGTSIQAFGEVDGTGHHTGELFVITPQSMHSHNVGDFLISRATKENADDYADEGSLMPSTPVAQYIQTDARSNSTATNANGNWFHAEKGTYASAMKDDDECVDIYQYVPGTRFARYRLIPSNQFPPVQPTLDITTAYNDDKTDITHFDGVATWQRPAGFGRSTGSANAKVVSYLFEMHNNKNELVSSAELPELYKTDGTPVDDEYVYDFNYTDTTGNKDIDFGRYSVNVRVKYQTKDGLYHISDPLYAEDIHDYPAKPAENLYIEAFIAEDITIGGWTQKDDGSWVVETQKADRYRIDLDFSKPTDAEPVSYYTLKAVVNKTAEYKGDTINIENFLLHNGAEIKDGKLWAKTTSTSQIPGTYDFDNAKAPYYTTVDANGDGLYNVTDGGSRQNVVLSYFYDVPVNNAGIATLANGDEVVINNTPDEWEFIIVAHYAARNTYIDKSKLVGITPNGLTPTGVEVVGDDNILAVQIYPIPAHSTITVKSPEAINSIVIYNEAGVEVMNLNGDGETVSTVNIEDLATGFYFVKVNNNAPVKIIKK